MDIAIIADSCCDLTPEWKAKLSAQLVPLTINIVDGPEYVDDGTANIPQMLQDMALSDKSPHSTCPSPGMYAAEMEKSDESFVVTLSDKLSASYSSAMTARDMVMEAHPEKRIHVFNSLSASVGESQIALFLHEKIKQGLPFDEIVLLGEQFAKSVRTFFVLEDLGNLFKNGRLSKIAGYAAGALRLCPVMGEDGEGHIRLVSPSLGIERSLRKLTDILAQHTAACQPGSIRLMMSFCNCLERALALKTKILNKCAAIGEVELVEMGGLSTLYANDGGIIVALPL